MELNRPYYPSLWFFLGAVIASLPWSWVVPTPQGLSDHQLQMIGAIWRATFLLVGFVSFLGYATGIAVFRARPQRRLSTAIGAVVGFGIVAASQLPQFASLNFGPLALAGVVVGLCIGLAIGFKERRATISAAG